MVIRLGRNGQVPRLLASIPEHKETRPLPGDEPPPPGGRRRACPKCGEGVARRQARPVRPVRRLLALSGLRLHPEGRPAAAGPAPVRGRLPQERGRSPRRRVARGGPGTSSGGAPPTRSATSRPTTSRSVRCPRRGRRSRCAPQGRGCDLPDLRGRRSTCRPTERRSRACVLPVVRPIPPPSPLGAPRAGGARGGSVAAHGPDRGQAARTTGRGSRTSKPVRRPRARPRLGVPARNPAAAATSVTATADGQPRWTGSSARSRRATHRHTPSARTDRGRRLPGLARRRVASTGATRLGATCGRTWRRLATINARSSVAQRLAAIRAFHRFAARDGLAPGDPWGAIATPRLPRRLPRVLEVDQVERAAWRRRRSTRS